MTGAISFAFGAGLLATVNPCGFVMLPSFLGLQLGMSDAADRTSPLARAAQGFGVGLTLSAAFCAVLVIAGVVLAAGLRSLVDVVPWLAIVVGAGLVVVGVAMLAGRHFSVPAVSRLRPASQARSGYARVASFGVGYAIASLSCTLAVVLAVASQATATANPIQFLGVFAAFAAGATSALLALSVSVALAKGIVARAMRRVAPLMNTLTAVLLAASGAYLVAYWLPAVLGDEGQQGGPVTEAFDGVSSTVANFFAAHTGAFAIGLGLAVVAALIVYLGDEQRGDHLTSTQVERRQ
jgi:cytochrome c-type biogenesis protein